MGTDIMAKLDSHLPEGVSEGLGNAGAKANEILSAFVAFIIKFLAAMPPFVNKHASTAKSYAREHIFPVVQPHLERFTSEARTRLAPATAWADKNLTPAYRDFETQFEAQTKEYSHLQIAAVAGVALLVFTWIASKLLSWFTTKPDQSYAQRAAVILRSLPIARGMVQKERAKVCHLLPADYIHHTSALHVKHIDVATFDQSNWYSFESMAEQLVWIQSITHNHSASSVALLSNTPSAPNSNSPAY